jgi:hypothetical protein
MRLGNAALSGMEDLIIPVAQILHCCAEKPSRQLEIEQPENDPAGRNSGCD